MPPSRPEVANFAAAGWSSPRVHGWGVRATAVRIASPSGPRPSLTSPLLEFYSIYKDVVLQLRS